MTTEYEALAEAHRRLRVAALSVVDEARAVGTPEHPMVGLPPYVLRRLRRELAGEPQPSGFWMSPS